MIIWDLQIIHILTERVVTYLACFWWFFFHRSVIILFGCWSSQKKPFSHNEKSRYKMYIDIKSLKALAVFCSDQYSKVFQMRSWSYLIFVIFDALSRPVKRTPKICVNSSQKIKTGQNLAFSVPKSRPT